jgi:DNA repair protein RadD
MDRWYQKEAITTTIAYLRLNKGTKNPLIVAPTGSGKSWIIAGLLHKLHGPYPNLEVLIISHVKEILEQNFEKLSLVLPKEKLGLYSASLKLRQKKQITVAGIQSIYKNPNLFANTKLIIIDEAHTIPPSSESMYQKLITTFQNVPIVGLTATPYRLGSGYLTDSGHIFNDIAYEVDLKRLIKEGYLCKLTSKAAKEQIDTSKLKVQAGDYSKKSMSEQIDRFNITNSICDELAKYKELRKHWLIFAVDIKHAENISAALNARGIAAAPYHSKMSMDERNLFIRLYKAGKIQCIINVNALTTGFDFPEIDLIGLLRPTKSPVLHVQMIGRGLRIAPEKENALILDFAGNLRRLGPIDKIEIQPPKKGKGSGRPPTKVCPQCDEVVALSAQICDSCGWKFESVNKLSLHAASDHVISDDSKPDFIKVNVRKVYYYLHEKENKPPSLKVIYSCDNLKMYTEWIFIEHSRELRAIAERWWYRRTNKDLPNTVTEVLELTAKNYLAMPKQIVVENKSKYPKIKQYIFEVTNESQTL